MKAKLDDLFSGTQAAFDPSRYPLLHEVENVHKLNLELKES